jgi:hypothetical protein
MPLDTSKLKSPTVFWAGVLVLVLTIGVLWSIAPRFPTTFGFSTEDVDALEKYKRILATHGYSYIEDKNDNGMPRVLVKGISREDYQKIECEFGAWRIGKPDVVAAHECKL